MKEKSVCGTVMVVVAWIFAGCGPLPPAAQGFIQSHTQCPTPVIDSKGWSADSKAIFYTLQAGGSGAGDLHKSASDGASDVVFIQNIQDVWISPDRSKVLYFREETTSPPSWNYYVATLAAGAERNISAPSHLTPVWSPDGRWLAWQGGATGLYITDLSTGDSRLLTGDSVSGQPIWSPDSKRLAVSIFGADGITSVYLVSIDNGQVTQVTGIEQQNCDYSEDSPIDWTPDGEFIAYTHWCGSAFTVREIRANGHESDRQASLPENLSPPVWSPDGTRAAYVIEQGGVDTIFISEADGSNARMLRRDARQPAWAPDGTRLSFVAFANATAPELFTIKADGTDERQITNYSNPGRVCWH